MTFSLALTLQTYAPETAGGGISAPTISSNGLADGSTIWRVTTDSPNSGRWHWARVTDGADAPAPDGAGGWSGTVLESGALAVGATGADLDIPETGTTGVTYQLYLYQRSSADSNVVVVSYVADNTPPQLTGLSFDVAGGTGSWSVTTDEAGTLWAVVTPSATAPTTQQIRAQQDHTGAAAIHAFRADPTGPETLTPGALSLPAPPYYLHLYQVDIAGNETAVQSLQAASASSDFVDSFDDPNGTLLRTKPGWTEVIAASFDVETRDGVAQAANVVAGDLVNDDRAVFIANFATADDSEIAFEVDSFSGASNRANFSILFRYTDVDNFLFIRFDQTQYYFREREAGVENSAGNGSLSLAPGDVVRATCVNRTLTLFVNDVEIDSTQNYSWGGIQAGGAVGLWFESRRNQDPDIPSIRSFTAKNL